MTNGPMRLLARPRLAALAAICAVAWPPAAGAQAAVRLPGLAVGGGDISAAALAETADGNVRVLTSDRPGRKTTVAVRTLGEAGWLDAATVLDRGSNYADGAFAPSGFVVLRSSYAPATGKQTGLSIVDLEAGGNVTATQRLPRREDLYGPFVGPTGAAALMLSHRVGRRQRVEFRWRPAGAARFGARTPIASRPADEIPADFEGSSQDDHEFRWAFASDGSAALLAIPDSARVGAPYIRRISAAGVLGPRIDLGVGRRDRVSGKLVFGETGVLTAAVSGRAKGAKSNELLVTRIAPGADASAPTQRLSVRDSRPVPFDVGFDLDAGPGDHVVLLASGGNGDTSRTVLFESRGGGPFAETATLPTVYPARLNVLPRADGSVAALWLAQAQDDFTDEGVYVSAIAPGGAFAPPRKVVGPAEVGSDFIDPLDVLGLRDGRIAFTYADYEGNAGPVYATIVRP